MRSKFLNPGIIALVFLTDRLSKTAVLNKLYLSRREVFSFFSLRYVENTGVAFGLFGGKNIFFLLSNTLLLGFLLFYRKRFSDPVSSLGIHLVIGGALGNIYDRIAYGYVVDFLDFHFFPAVFNLADSAITVGACLIALSVLNEKRQKGGT